MNRASQWLHENGLSLRSRIPNVRILTWELWAQQGPSYESVHGESGAQFCQKTAGRTNSAIHVAQGYSFLHFNIRMSLTLADHALCYYERGMSKCFAGGRCSATKNMAGRVISGEDAWVRALWRAFPGIWRPSGLEKSTTTQYAPQDLIWEHFPEKKGGKQVWSQQASIG